MLKYFALAVVLLQIQVGSAYANNSDINKGLKDEQSYQLNFQKLKQGKPSSPAEIYYNRGNARYKLGDKQGAIQDYNQAIKINPNEAKAYYGRGNVRSDLGDKQGAIQDYNQAIKINPKDAEAYYNRGFVRSKLGDKQGAIDDYNQAIKINPGLSQHLQ